MSSEGPVQAGKKPDAPSQTRAEPRVELRTEPTHALLRLQRRAGNHAVNRLLVQRTPLPLPTFPDDRAPNPAEIGLMQAGANFARDIIGELTSNAVGDQCIDATFGALNNAAAKAVYVHMANVLADWSAQAATLVTVSGWNERFGREAATRARDLKTAQGAHITVPSGVLNEAPSELALTLLHESAHGVDKGIIDIVPIGKSGFKNMPGTQRLTHAYHLEGAARAYMDPGGPDGYLAENMGNPNVAAVGGATTGLAKAPTFGTVLQDAQSIIMHARVHAENVLKMLVEAARRDEAPSDLMGYTKPMNLPIHSDWNPFGKLTQADITKAENFTTMVTNLYGVATGLSSTVNLRPNSPELVKIVPPTAFFQTKTGNIEGGQWVVKLLDEMMLAYKIDQATGVTTDALLGMDKIYWAVRR